ncbi:glycosyltransferase [Acidobacteria bacterium AH-259-G07]|nr:glycosyltransferase [Acidobacteria bacterium AH-259-G07]
MEQPLLSIIIPTYNRKPILKKTLAALQGQPLEKTRYEVIVVDDGSTDGTSEELDQWAATLDLNLKVFHQTNRGQGPARNLALGKAAGKYILFLGDDIIPGLDFLNCHLEAHEREPKSVAVVGFTDWHEGQEITEFMRFIAPYGQQFNFEKVEKHPRNLSFAYFYTSNISLESKWLQEERFDEDFKGYGCEDQELGYRLVKKGLELIFVKEARAFHLHPLTEEDLCRRMRSSGRALFVFFKKHPQIHGTVYLHRWPMLIWMTVFLLYKLRLARILDKKLHWNSMLVYHQYTGFLRARFQSGRPAHLVLK